MKGRLSRRKFIGAGAAGVAALGCTGSAEREDNSAAQEGRDRQEIGPFELDEMTIAEMGQAMRSGRYSSERITGLYLSRIGQLDRSGPALNCLLDVNPDAEEIARALDDERKSGKVRGPLHGVPVIVKDNIDTHDRMTTTAGSLALEGSIAPRDAGLVEKLRSAGAVILAKANLSEWANFRTNQSSSGWSARGGQTRNPYVLDRNPSGSSSGSAVAAAANLCAAAVGTETYGSIMGPSNNCCVVGIKPTVGLVSRSGIIPISHTQDTAGPMARTVADAAALLGAMAGPDTRDEATLAGEGRIPEDYTAFLDPDGLRGARIGIVRRFFKVTEEVDRRMEEVLALLESEGAELIDPVEIPNSRKYESFTVMLYEFKHGLNEYLSRLGPEVRVKTLEQLIEFNEAHREREMPYFGQSVFLQAQEKGGLDSEEYLEALKNNIRYSREEGLDKLFAEQELDALMAPTGAPATPIDLVNGSRYIGGSSGPAAVSGYPNINVPAGFAFGLPFGVSFFGTAWSEPKLISIAHAFEQATKVRRTPEFLPTLRF